MTLHSVTSSNIKQYGYEDGVLEIHFTSGGIYRYSGVPWEVVEQFRNAQSIGSFFYSAIRAQYPAEKVV